MQRRLTKEEFCKLMQRRQDLRRRRKALQEWRQRQDEWAMELGRADRIYKKSGVIV